MSNLGHCWVALQVLTGRRGQPWRSRGCFGTVRAQRVHGANYYVASPTTTPENHPPTEWGAEFRTLGTVASIRLKKKTLMYQQGL